MPPAKSETKIQGEAPKPEVQAPPAEFKLSQSEMDNLIATKVSEGIAAALPAVLQQIMAGANTSQGPQFAGGMGPSEQVVMQNVQSQPKAKTYLKHYRKDDAVNGKHQFIDVTKLVDGDFGEVDEKGNLPGVVKGRWIHFVNGDFYATKEEEVAFIEWKKARDPMCRIYEVTGRGVIPCDVVNCTMTFASQEDLDAHKAATHGLTQPKANPFTYAQQ